MSFIAPNFLLLSVCLNLSRKYAERVAVGSPLFGHVDLESSGGPIRRFNGPKRLGLDQCHSKNGQLCRYVVVVDECHLAVRVTHSIQVSNCQTKKKQKQAHIPYLYLYATKCQPIHLTAKLGPALCLLMVSFTGCDRLSTLILLVLAVGLQGAVFR